MPHKKKYNSKYVFIVNYAETENNNEKIHNKIFNINETNIDLKRYSLKKRNGNCYFWVRND